MREEGWGEFEQIKKGEHLHHSFGRTLSYYAPIHHLFSRYGKLSPGKKFLHLGSSTGLYTEFLQEQGVHAVGLDINSFANQAARKAGNKRSIRGDAQRLPFKDGTFHFALSDHFLFSHYFSHEVIDGKIVQELARVMK
ncbi:MAG: class I SAM-dependent methyltransferase, partial [archaeon]